MLHEDLFTVRMVVLVAAAGARSAQQAVRKCSYAFAAAPEAFW
ncbi:MULTISPECIES: hypothetical protein [unclassified Streptomyces]|nr:hypothetical protein [Streptomyces sp. JV176]MEE1799653.1 hypothetical protein [Streptomyces sp. JV176]